MAIPTFLNFLEGTLDVALTSTASTVVVAIAQKFQKNDNSFYDLVNDKTTTLVIDIELTVNHLTNAKVELMRCSGITQTGTTTDGRPIYTLTIETTGATKLRGMANSYDGTTSTTNVIANNTIAQFPKNSPCRITVNTGSLQRAIDLFVATTGEDSAELGETVADNEVVAIQDSDGKLYQFDSTDSNRDTIVGILKTGEGGSAGATATFTTLNGKNTGHTGLTKGAQQFASTVTPGAITETPNKFLIGIADATGTIINSGIAIVIDALTQAQVDDITNTAEGTISGLLLNNSILRPTIEFNTDFTPNGSDTYTERYKVTTANGGSVLATADRGGLDLRADTTANSFASLFANTPQIKINNVIHVSFTAGTTLISDTQQYFIGFKANATEFAASDDIKTTNQKQVGFLFKRESGTTNLFAISADSTIETTLASVTPASGEFMALDILYTETSIKFFVDGTLEATHTTDVPTNTTKGNHIMYWAVGSLATGANANNNVSGTYNFRQYLS